MPRKMLRDDQWERLEDLLPGKATDCGVTAKDNRLSWKRCGGLHAPVALGVICRRTRQVSQHLHALLALEHKGRLAACH